jgi:TatD DNase family protein
MLIDSHCHLNYDYSPKTAADLVREAKEAGIEYLLSIGVDFDSIAPIQKISEEFDNVYHSVGVHPHEAQLLDVAQVDILRTAARHPKCRAIGEIGLDYYYNHSNREDQIRALNLQLDLALELGQPVVIHARDAEEDLLVCLKRYVAQAKTAGPPGAIHCFTGTQKFGAACIEMGFLVSLSGILTFKNSQDLRSSVRTFPLESLMVETDSPYLAPTPHRGKKCEPRMVIETAKVLADVLGEPLEKVAEITTRNAKKFFRIS